MGTIVINQTDCKQNVVLQSSLDGITGGYYDAAGVWHEIGESLIDAELVWEMDVTKLEKGKGLSNTSPYYTSGPKRESYLDFDILIPGGKFYYLVADTATTPVFFGTQWFNQKALDKVAANENINSSDIYDSGSWMPATGYIMDIPASKNSSDIKGTRVTFRPDPDANLPDDFNVTSFKIYEVTF